MFAGKIDKSRYGYLFIAPFFLVFFIFDLGPILYSFYLSFTDWSGFDTPSFIGLANYERLLQDTLFFKSIYNTLVIWILSIVPQLTIALTLALILHEKFIRGKHLFHAIFYFPNMVTPVTMGVLFALIFDWQNGSANKIIMALGIVDDPVNWFNSPFLAQLIVASILMWQWFGFNMLVFLAGLQSIPEDLYEAAEIDGANKFQTAIKITLPLLRPVLIFTMITSVIGGMQIFDQPLMIGKGPENSTLTMVMHLYEAAFVRYEYGYGAAIAYGIFVLIAVATAFSMWMTKIREKKEGVS